MDFDLQLEVEALLGVAAGRRDQERQVQQPAAAPAGRQVQQPAAVLERHPRPRYDLLTLSVYTGTSSVWCGV